MRRARGRYRSRNRNRLCRSAKADSDCDCDPDPDPDDRLPEEAQPFSFVAGCAEVHGLLTAISQPISVLLATLPGPYLLKSLEFRRCKKKSSHEWHGAAELQPKNPGGDTEHAEDCGRITG